MTTETDTVLDQRTRDELQPPCDLPFNNAACPRAAEWIIWVTSPVMDSPKLLACDAHCKEALAHRRSCRSCRKFTKFHMEQLR